MKWQGARRLKLGEAARKADRVWADSAFNAGELAELGIDDVHVFPLLFNPKTFDAPSGDNVFNKFPVRIPTLTWIGRLVPNKRVEDLIIVDTEDALLICSREREQEVKALVEHLETHGQTEWL